MPDIITVAAHEAPGPAQSKAIRSGPLDIALFRVGDEYYAIDNECPHYGAPLTDGWVDATVVSCPWHCWQFDVTTGQCLTVPGCDVKTYPVRVADGTVQIVLDE